MPYCCRTDSGKSAQNEIAEGGVVVVDSAVVPLRRRIVAAQDFPRQPFAGKGIEIFVDKGNGFAVEKAK